MFVENMLTLKVTDTALTSMVGSQIFVTRMLWRKGINKHNTT
jgi:hypothetical protein